MLYSIELPPLFELQQQIADDIARFKVISCGRRFGKGIPLDTKIPIRDGFKLMRDIEVGDKIYGSDGKECNVLFVSDIHNIDCYRITFNDHTSIITDSEHQWLTWTKLERKNTARGIRQGPNIRNTLEIKNTLKYGLKSESNHAIQMCQSVEYSKKNYIIEPYILGLWLGDGFKHNGEITITDEEIFKYIEEYGYKILYHENDITYTISKLITQLRKIGVLLNKHIPNDYLYGSIEQRLNLLKGLMDTDGSVEPNKLCSFANTNKDIIDGMCQLLSSLGIRYNVYEKYPKCNGKICNKVWTIYFSSDFQVFKLTRKLNKQFMYKHNKQFRYIVSVEKVNSVPTKCITVDSKDNTYLITDKFIVTHNTLMCVEICFKKSFDGKRVWWVAHNYSTAGIAFRMAMALVNQLPKEFNVTYNIATRTINFNITGGEFVFKSSDRPDNLRGEALDFLVMDEAEFHKKNVWDEILRPALADRKGGAIFISTPKKENGWFHQMYKQGLASTNNNIKSFHASSYMNPYLDPEELNAIREVTPDIIFRQEFMAEFVSGAGARVKRENIQYVGLDEIENNKNIVVAIGADLAIGEKEINDYTAICAIAKNIKDGNIYILDVYRERMSFRRQKERIIGFAEKWNRQDLGWPEIVIGIESQAYQRALVQEVNRDCGFATFGIPANKNKTARFASLEAKYEMKQIYHVENLPLAFENELMAFPEGQHDDYVDSLTNGYAAINKAYGFTDSGFTFDLNGKDNVFSI